jgi:hypothetical protein
MVDWLNKKIIYASFRTVPVAEVVLRFSATRRIRNNSRLLKPL